MYIDWRELANRITKNYLFDGEGSDKKQVPELPEAVRQARQEWLDAQNYYQFVSDKDLVDHAVYMMQAAEKKYMYLLKQARLSGVTYSPYMNSDVDAD